MRQIVPHFVYFLYSFPSHSPRSPFLSFCHDSMQVNQTTALTLFLGFAWVWFGLFFLCFLNAFAFLGLLHIDFSQFVSLLLLLLLLIFIKLLFTSALTGTAAFGSLLFWVYFTIMLTANLTHNSASLARHTCGCTQILSYTHRYSHTLTCTHCTYAVCFQTYVLASCSQQSPQDICRCSCLTTRDQMNRSLWTWLQENKKEYKIFEINKSL